jgi:LacI family transcriptional regulator
MGKISSMITSEQVARLAGVSRATVSRVLNGSANVSEETKKRIYTAVNTLGYGANAFTRVSSQQRSHVIALALFGSDDGLNLSQITATRCYFYLEQLGFIERSAAKEKLDLFLPLYSYDTADSLEEDYALALRAKHIAGLLAVALRPNDPRIQAILRSSIPAVFIDNVLQGERATYVKSDFMTGAYQAAEHLLQLGHRRIAFFPGDTLVLTGTERLLGYQRALAHAGLLMDPDLVRPSEWETKSAYEAAMTLLSERRDFTAIFAASDMMALGVMRALRKHGLRVPEDISIIGFDDIDLSEDADPPLTTIHQDKQTIGEGAIARLMQLLQEKETPEPLIVPTRLVVRASTSPLTTR